MATRLTGERGQPSPGHAQGPAQPPASAHPTCPAPIPPRTHAASPLAGRAQHAHTRQEAMLEPPELRHQENLRKSTRVPENSSPPGITALRGSAFRNVSSQFPSRWQTCFLKSLQEDPSRSAAHQAGEGQGGPRTTPTSTGPVPRVTSQLRQLPCCAGTGPWVHRGPAAESLGPGPTQAPPPHTGPASCPPAPQDPPTQPPPSAPRRPRPTCPRPSTHPDPSHGSHDLHPALRPRHVQAPDVLQGKQTLVRAARPCPLWEREQCQGPWRSPRSPPLHSMSAGEPFLTV